MLLARLAALARHGPAPLPLPPPPLPLRERGRRRGSPMAGGAEGGASAEEAGGALWGARVAVRAELRPPPGSARESSEEEEGGWELTEGRRPRPPAVLAPVPVVAPLTALVAALRPAVEPYLPGAGPHELWLSAGSEVVPLRWHCPAGVLFDLFGGPAPSPSSVGPDPAAGAGVLWQLGVHCGGLPRGELLPLGGGWGRGTTSSTP